MHTSQNVGGTTFRVVEVELRKPAGRVETSGRAGIFRTEFQNEQVRVLRAKLAPRQTLSGHDMSLRRILVPLTDMDVEFSGTRGARAVTAKPGTAIFDSDPRDRLENRLTVPVEFVIIELKQ
jgi:hypothetical protein